MDGRGGSIEGRTRREHSRARLVRSSAKLTNNRIHNESLRMSQCPCRPKKVGGDGVYQPPVLVFPFPSWNCSCVADEAVPRAYLTISHEHEGRLDVRLIRISGGADKRKTLLSFAKPPNSFYWAINSLGALPHRAPAYVCSPPIRCCLMLSWSLSSITPCCVLCRWFTILDLAAVVEVADMTCIGPGQEQQAETTHPHGKQWRVAWDRDLAGRQRSPNNTMSRNCCGAPDCEPCRQ